MEFRSIDELLLYVRTNQLTYSSATYNDKRIVLVAFPDGTDSYLFDEFTGDRV
jgi:hypothetical protein